MKSIQVMFDERLLVALDHDAEVKRDGRSAVLRRAAAEYLKRRRSTSIAEAYRKAYSKDGSLGEEFSGWEEQGEWPATAKRCEIFAAPWRSQLGAMVEGQSLLRRPGVA